MGAVYKLGAVYGDGLSLQEIEALRDAVKLGEKDPHVLTEKMRSTVKLSEQSAKTSIPGDLDVLRFMTKHYTGSWLFDGDVIYDRTVHDPVKAGAANEDYGDTLTRDIESVRKTDETLSKIFNKGTHVYRPLKPAFVQGRRVRPAETVHQARERGQDSLSKLDFSHKRRLNPHTYVVGLENSLYEKRRRMILDIRRGHKRPKKVA